MASDSSAGSLWRAGQRPVIEALILRKEIDHEHCRVFVEMVAVEKDAQGNEIARGGVAQFYLDCSQPMDVARWLEHNRADIVKRFEHFRANANAFEQTCLR